MATSPSHKFGQIIGDLLEEMLQLPLTKVAKKHGLYLDYKHPRLARGGKRKVTWIDHKGNRHDLDFVLELGGSEDNLGIPKAFIETAWRRYTKHSRNKAQEIQGAVSVLAETYSHCNPFLGVVLAGVFTEGSLTQLASHGFKVVYCSYENVLAAFAKVGIDASFDERTSDRAFKDKVDTFINLPASKRAELVTELRKRTRKDLNTFVKGLETCLTRTIERILVIPLHGPTCEVMSVNDALSFINSYDEASPIMGVFVRYEVSVRYTNGDQINGQFESRATAIQFLNGLG